MIVLMILIKKKMLEIIHIKYKPITSNVHLVLYEINHYNIKYILYE